MIDAMTGVLKILKPDFKFEYLIYFIFNIKIGNYLTREEEIFKTDFEFVI